MLCRFLDIIANCQLNFHSLVFVTSLHMITCVYRCIYIFKVSVFTFWTMLCWCLDIFANSKLNFHSVVFVISLFSSMFHIKLCVLTEKCVAACRFLVHVTDYSSMPLITHRLTTDYQLITHWMHIYIVMPHIYYYIPPFFLYFNWFSCYKSYLTVAPKYLCDLVHVKEKSGYNARPKDGIKRKSL